LDKRFSGRQYVERKLLWQCNPVNLAACHCRSEGVEEAGQQIEKAGEKIQDAAKGDNK